MRPGSTLALAAASVFLVVGCTTASPSPSGVASETPANASGTPAPAPSGSGPAASAVPSASAAAPTIDRPWATEELVDVATGESFRIADLAGKVVIVETMAAWCSNCFSQQQAIYQALEQLDPERVAYVLIDTDTSESAEELAAYRASNGFTGTYAIATDAVARALIEEFGEQVVNPPSTPKVFIAADGTVGDIIFGSKSADDVVAIAQSLGA